MGKSRKGDSTRFPVSGIEISKMWRHKLKFCAHLLKTAFGGTGVKTVLVFS